MTELEINQMMYENLLMTKIIAFIALFLIICVVGLHIYSYLQTRATKEKKHTPFFYKGTYDDFIKENKK